MQTPDRYWEGLYWDGFSPETIGAVGLPDAESDDLQVAMILEATRQRLVGDKEDPSEYFVTISDSDVAAEAAEELAKAINRHPISDPAGSAPSSIAASVTEAVTASIGQGKLIASEIETKSEAELAPTEPESKASASPADRGSASASSGSGSGSGSASASGSASEIICRLWHANVFLGARDSALGNPGEKCRNYHFDSHTGVFIKETAMETELAEAS